MPNHRPAPRPPAAASPDAPPPGEPPERPGELWLLVFLALLSFNAAAFLIGRVVPADTRGDIGSAQRRFREQADEIDLVVIGSSRVQEGLDVEQVEQELREAGRELRVFNFGAGGMRTLEQGHVLRWVLAQRAPRLKWVVLEAWPLGITLRRNTDYSRKAEVISARVISWHTARVTRRALAAIWRFPLPAAERLRMARHHLDAWGRRVWNLGLLSERLFESTKARGQREQVAEGRPPVENGEDGETPGFGRVLGTERTKRSEEKVHGVRTELTPEQLERRVAHIPVQNRMPVDFAELDLELLAERDREARRAGVELIYLTMPGESGCPEILRLHEAGLLGPLLHFDDPERYPELFGEELHETPAHLNREGARVFSRLFARKFLELCASD